MILISQTIAGDKPIHSDLNAILGARKMMVLSVSQLRGVADRVEDESHPFLELTEDAELEDAALGGVKGVRALRRRPATRFLSLEELQRARRAAEEVGRAGEELVCQYLINLKKHGQIRDFVWTADRNAVAPYDFLLVTLEGREVAIDVKSTSGEFERSIHISFAELIEMTGVRRYDIYRVFSVADECGEMRVTENVGPFAAEVLKGINLPDGVTTDSISAGIGAFDFGQIIHLEPPDNEE